MRGFASQGFAPPVAAAAQGGGGSAGSGGGATGATDWFIGNVDYHEMSLDVRDSSLSWQALAVAGDAMLNYHETSLDVRVSPDPLGVETDLL